MQRSARRVDDGMQLYVGSGLWIGIIAYLVMLEIWAFGTVSIYEWGIGEAARDPRLQAVFVIDFILGFLYIAWYQKNVTGFTNSARAFLNLCEQTLLMAGDTLSLVKDMQNILLYMKTPHDKGGSPHTQQQDSQTLMIPVSSAYSFSGIPSPSVPPFNMLLPFINTSAPPQTGRASAGQKMYAAHAHEPPKASTLQEDCALMLCMRDSCIAIVWATFRFYDPTDGAELAIEAPAVRKIVQIYAGQPVEMVNRLCSLVLVTIKLLELSGKLGHGDLKLIFEKFSKVEEHTATLRVESSITEPTVFDGHMNLILGVYFFVWLPYTLWFALGWKLTLVFYPLVVYLLTGFALVRWWIGESFDSNSRYRYMNHIFQRDTYIVRIRETFDINRCGFLSPPVEF